MMTLLSKSNPHQVRSSLTYDTFDEKLPSVMPEPQCFPIHQTQNLSLGFEKYIQSIHTGIEDNY